MAVVLLWERNRRGLCGKVDGVELVVAVVAVVLAVVELVVAVVAVVVAAAGLKKEQQPCFLSRAKNLAYRQRDPSIDHREEGGSIFGSLHNIHRSNTRGSGGRWIQDKYDDGIRVLPALVFI